jgi:hypothetical protein
MPPVEATTVAAFGAGGLYGLTNESMPRSGWSVRPTTESMGRRYRRLWDSCFFIARRAAYARMTVLKRPMCPIIIRAALQVPNGES